MQQNEFLQELRTKTAANHQALESVALSADLMSEKVTLQHYTGYLKNLYGFIEPFETSVYLPFKKQLPHFNYQLKWPLLISDLQMLGEQPKDLPLFKQHLLTVNFQTPAACLGGLYVLEGSTLGGMFINNHLQQKLSTAINGKTAYLQVYGNQTGSSWKNFLALLCEAAVHSGREQEIIEAAVVTFEMLERWMTQAPVVNVGENTK